MELPGADSQIFTAGNVQGFFEYEVKFAAFIVIKLWL